MIERFSMKKITLSLCALAMMCTSTMGYGANNPTKVGLVNFRGAVEKSELGKKEQETFEMMKNQMESIIKEKESSFQDVAKKMQDEDYRDSLAPDALEKMEKQYQTLGQELSQAQNQYFQALQQANYKILQKISEIVSNAAEKVARDKGLDLVLNDENSFYKSPNLDITDAVVVEMDKIYKEELKNMISNPQQGPESK